MMLTNFFKIAFRNLVNQRAYSLLNLAGLSMGLTCVLIIVLYLKNELTFDQFHNKAAQIYRLTGTTTDAAGAEIKNQTGNTGAIQGPAFAAAIPEIMATTRMEGVFFNVRRGNDGFYQNAHYVDSNFFETFSFPLLDGNAHSALSAVNSVVLTEKEAAKYFGTVHALGQSLSLEISGKFEPFTVTGVALNPPPNSSLQFEMLLSFAYLESKFQDENWLNQYLATFFVLRPGASPTLVGQKIARVFAILGRQQVAKAAQERGYREQRRFGLQPLTTIHTTLAYGAGNELAAPTSPVMLYLLGGIALFILTIACINFVNLTVARSLSRAREIGVRKVLGGQRGQLMAQFLGESFLLSAIAFGMALGLAQLVLPFFNAIAGTELNLAYLFDVWLVAVYGGLLVLTTLLAGAYPAFVLSRFRPTQALYGHARFQGKNYLGQGLVVVQFALSVFLIVATMVVFTQFDFLATKDLGYDPEWLVRIELPSLRDGNDVFAQRIKQQLANQPGIRRVATKNWLDEYTRARAGNKEVDVNLLRIDDTYLPTMGISIMQGRNFSSAYPSDTLDKALVNETFVREMGWENPLGRQITVPQQDNRRYSIVGVVNDYHFNSLHEKIRPQVFVGDAYMTFGEMWVKIQPKNVAQTINLLNRTYRAIIPQHYYKYQFLDLVLAKQYEQENQLRQFITWASGLCLFIACLGLFGLSIFVAEQRTKEIGIRKVLGASVAEIVALLSANLLKLVLIAIVIASPIAWYAMHRWLQDFAYKITIEWWVFLLAGLLAVGIALLTVSFQSIRAALMNPVKSLRSE